MFNVVNRQNSTFLEIKIENIDVVFVKWTSSVVSFFANVLKQNRLACAYLSNQLSKWFSPAALTLVLVHFQVFI